MVTGERKNRPKTLTCHLNLKQLLKTDFFANVATKVALQACHSSLALTIDARIFVAFQGAVVLVDGALDVASQLHKEVI